MNPFSRCALLATVALAGGASAQQLRGVRGNLSSRSSEEKIYDMFISPDAGSWPPQYKHLRDFEASDLVYINIFDVSDRFTHADALDKGISSLIVRTTRHLNWYPMDPDDPDASRELFQRNMDVGANTWALLDWGDKTAKTMILLYYTNISVPLLLGEYSPCHGDEPDSCSFGIAYNWESQTPLTPWLSIPWEYGDSTWNEEKNYQQFGVKFAGGRVLMDSRCAQDFLFGALPSNACREDWKSSDAVRQWDEECVSYDMLVKNLNDLVQGGGMGGCNCTWNGTDCIITPYPCGEEFESCCLSQDPGVWECNAPDHSVLCNADHICTKCPPDPCQDNWGCATSEHFCPDGGTNCYPTGRSGCNQFLCPACDPDAAANSTIFALRSDAPLMHLPELITYLLIWVFVVVIFSP